MSFILSGLDTRKFKKALPRTAGLWAYRLHKYGTKPVRCAVVKAGGKWWVHDEFLGVVTTEWIAKHFGDEDVRWQLIT